MKTTMEQSAVPAVTVPTGMVHIAGGTFTMGSPATEPERWEWEGPQHQVTVSGFYMGKYVVTQKEWREVMGNNPSNFKGDDLPVESVSWYDAVEYCNKRGEREGLTPAYTINRRQKDPNNTNDDDDDPLWTVTWNKSANGYRLPTEAEWEYSCRAGTTTPFSTGNNITTDQANYDGSSPYNDNAKGKNRKKTTPVGSFAPNPWGLSDMHGNVCEWCWDWCWDGAGADDLDEEGYSAVAQTDPTGTVSGTERAIRGGSWDESGDELRSASRQSLTPSSRSYFIGFRLVRPL